MPQRLPVPGSDNGTWGYVLNGYLGVAHNADGTLIGSAVSTAGAEMTSNKGAASGYAGLDGNAKINIANLPTGTSSTTVAIGSDSRITGALQASNNLSDVSNAGTALSNLGASSALTATAVQTTTYTAAANQLIPCDATSGGFTVTLPASPADKIRIIIKKIDSSTNAVTVATSGSDVFNRIGGNTTAALSLQNQAVTVQYASSGGVWYVSADDLPLSQLDSRYPLSTATPGGDLSGTYASPTVVKLQGVVTLSGTPSANLVLTASSGTAASWTALPSSNTHTVATKTSSYNVLTTDEVILANATGGAITITLPTAVGAKQAYTVKKIDSSSNAITIATTSSQTIDGVATATIRVQYASILVVSDGSNWNII